MDKKLAQKSFLLKDPKTLLLFVAVSLCFKNTHSIGLLLFGVITCFEVYQLFRNKISNQYFFTIYFYLLIYASIFYDSIHKIILCILLLFFLKLIVNRKIKSRIPKKLNEYLFLMIFILITLNHLIFPPYLKGLDIFIYFLLIPLLFLGIKKLHFKICIITSLKVYITSVFIASVLLFIINIFQRKLMSSVHTFFSEPIGLSHVYMGVFLGTSNMFLLYLNSKKKSFISPITDSIFFMFNTALMAYIGSRLALLTSCFILLLFIYQKIKIKPIKKITIIFVLTVIFIFLASENSRFKRGTQEISALYTAVKTENKQNLIDNSWKNMYLRYLAYDYTFKELKTSWFLGIGMQNVEKKISEKIIADGYKYFQGINTHNQYLHFFIGMGILGFLFFIFFIFFLLKNKEINIYFILFFCFIMLTESVLVRGKGILLFSFFALLFLNKKFVNDKDCSHC
ncbi:O-antigen ligase family protein [Tenacibaculum jejuense]|nr:O-antigen ligase family protein [Tenacibaculum jejuense]